MREKRPRVVKRKVGILLKELFMTQDEIRSVIREITATVTFLPLLEVPCSFDLLIYTDKDLVVPGKWEESGPQFITDSEQVRLRSFTATVHKVNSMVAHTIPILD